MLLPNSALLKPKNLDELGQEPLIDAYLVVQAPPGQDTLRSDYLQANEAQAVLDVKTRLNAWAAIHPLDVIGLPSRAGLLALGVEASLRIAQSVRNAVIEVVVRIRIRVKDIPFFRGLENASPSPPQTFLVTGFGIEATIAGAGYWNPMPEGGRGFSNRAAAEKLIGSEVLAESRLTGEGVNLVLMDSGLDPIERQQLDLNWGQQIKGSLHLKYAPEAPAAPRYDHAWHMARHVKALAPDVMMHDYAVLPPRLSKAFIPSIQVKYQEFVSTIVAAYLLLYQQIKDASERSKRPWVVINAWALYRRPPTLRADYTEEELQTLPNLRIRPIVDEFPEYLDLDFVDHRLNRLIAEMVRDFHVDFVFAAGNCGQFSVDARCGLNDRGPGRSILGPAGHPDVTTVAACRADMTWVGSSSQGPSIMAIAGAKNPKPDLSAPSCFFENDDASLMYSGTSTACALTGAAIAALRTRQTGWHPTQLKNALISTARRPPDTPLPGWRFGEGILDLEAAVPRIL